MKIKIAKELSVYLKQANSSLVDRFLFTDFLPVGAAEAILLEELGGELPVLDVSESSCCLSITVCSQSQTRAYDRIWELVKMLTEPTSGIIKVNGRSYTVNMVTLPAPERLEEEGRHVMSCLVRVSQVSEVVEEWLETLVRFTEFTLGEGWRVYRGFQGSCRPSVSWQCTGRELNAAVGMVSRLVKRFSARICAEDADSYQYAVDKLMIALANQIKFTSVTEGIDLSISGITETRAEKGQATGELTIALAGQIPRAQPAAPYMSGVRFQAPFAFAK
ncbi:hypothetical protein B5M42_011580 [Paenibacillus athensensis]|uniref:Uncharacterized protein n=1 Tax=Paenibacillus athensensis TaxID=1967502 RepID=A0A4Y8Q5G8_9BACL|nr:hypothetical protein [Paenibacillus athensensis]MCD1259475.1 hypothetical protein [Paenibacillus athensensis]